MPLAPLPTVSVAASLPIGLNTAAFKGRTIKFLPTKAPTLAAGIKPYLTPNVPATGSAAVKPPPKTAPSAPNLNFSLKYSTALAEPSNSFPL